MPLAADNLQLMDSPFIRAKKIESIGENSFLSGTNTALCPAGRFGGPPAARCGGRGFDSKIDGILNAGRKCGNKVASPLDQVAGGWSTRASRGQRLICSDLVLWFFGFDPCFGKCHDRRNPACTAHHLFGAARAGLRRKNQLCCASDSIGSGGSASAPALSICSSGSVPAFFSSFLWARRSAFMRCFSIRFISFWRF